MTAANLERGSTTAEVALAFPMIVALLLALSLVVKDGSARTDVQELAQAAAEAGVSAAGPREAADAAREAVRAATREQGYLCVNARASIVDPRAFRPGGTVEWTVSCDVPLDHLLPAPVGGVRTYSDSAKRRVDPYREVNAS